MEKFKILTGFKVDHPEEIKDREQHVQEKNETRDGGNDDGGGGGDPPPQPPKVSSKSKSLTIKKVQREEPLPRGFLIPFPLYRCSWSPEDGTKRWSILNLVLVGIAIIISLANLVLVQSKSHDPERHKLFMAFHPSIYWKCNRMFLTVDVASTFGGELVYLVACAFLLLSVLYEETNTKILLAKFYIYISILFPIGYLPRLFLISNAPCKDRDAMINFGLIVVLLTLYLLLWLWLLVGQRLVRSYILWLRYPNAEEFYWDDDSEQIDLEEGQEYRQSRPLTYNLQFETDLAVKPKPSPIPSPKSSKSSKSKILLKFKQSQTSVLDEIPSPKPTRPILNPKDESEDKDKNAGFFRWIMRELKKSTKKK